jgi:hypothetical protein
MFVCLEIWQGKRVSGMSKAYEKEFSENYLKGFK